MRFFTVHIYIFNYDCSWNYHSYINVFIEVWVSSLNDVLRRASAWLSVMMALTRFLIMKNSLNPKYQFLSKPKFALISMFLAFWVSLLVSVFYLIRVTITEVEPWTPAD